MTTARLSKAGGFLFRQLADRVAFDEQRNAKLTLLCWWCWGLKATQNNKRKKKRRKKIQKQKKGDTETYWQI